MHDGRLAVGTPSRCIGTTAHAQLLEGLRVKASDRSLALIAAPDMRGTPCACYRSGRRRESRGVLKGTQNQPTDTAFCLTREMPSTGLQLCDAKSEGIVISEYEMK
jgi:hypothetical protein